MAEELFKPLSTTDKNRYSVSVEYYDLLGKLSVEQLDKLDTDGNKYKITKSEIESFGIRSDMSEDELQALFDEDNTETSSSSSSSGSSSSSKGKTVKLASSTNSAYDNYQKKYGKDEDGKTGKERAQADLDYDYEEIYEKYIKHHKDKNGDDTVNWLLKDTNKSDAHGKNYWIDNYEEASGDGEHDAMIGYSSIRDDKKNSSSLWNTAENIDGRDKYDDLTGYLEDIQTEFEKVEKGLSADDLTPEKARDYLEDLAIIAITSRNVEAAVEHMRSADHDDDTLKSWGYADTKSGRSGEILEGNITKTETYTKSQPDGTQSLPKTRTVTNNSAAMGAKDYLRETANLRDAAEDTIQTQIKTDYKQAKTDLESIGIKDGECKFDSIEDLKASDIGEKVEKIGNITKTCQEWMSLCTDYVLDTGLNEDELKDMCALAEQTEDGKSGYAQAYIDALGKSISAEYSDDTVQLTINSKDATTKVNNIKNHPKLKGYDTTELDNAITAIKNSNQKSVDDKGASYTSGGTRTTGGTSGGSGSSSGSSGGSGSGSSGGSSVADTVTGDLASAEDATKTSEGVKDAAGSDYDIDTGKIDEAAETLEQQAQDTVDQYASSLAAIECDTVEEYENAYKEAQATLTALEGKSVDTSGISSAMTNIRTKEQEIIKKEAEDAVNSVKDATTISELTGVLSDLQSKSATYAGYGLDTGSITSAIDSVKSKAKEIISKEAEDAVNNAKGLTSGPEVLAAIEAVDAKATEYQGYGFDTSELSQASSTIKTNHEAYLSSLAQSAISDLETITAEKAQENLTSINQAIEDNSGFNTASLLVAKKLLEDKISELNKPKDESDTSITQPTDITGGTDKTDEQDSSEKEKDGDDTDKDSSIEVGLSGVKYNDTDENGDTTVNPSISLVSGDDEGEEDNTFSLVNPNMGNSDGNGSSDSTSTSISTSESASASGSGAAVSESNEEETGHTVIISRDEDFNTDFDDNETISTPSVVETPQETPSSVVEETPAETDETPEVNPSNISEETTAAAAQDSAVSPNEDEIDIEIEE